MFYKNRGFTLLELLVVTSILSILVIFSIPHLSDLVAKHRRILTEEHLLSALNFARMTAINNSSLVTICPSEDKRTCDSNWQETLIIFFDQNRDEKADTKEQIVRVLNPVKYGTLDWKAFPKTHYLRYDSNSFTDNQNGTFSYCYQHQGWQLIVNRAGRIRSKQLLAC